LLSSTVEVRITSSDGTVKTNMVKEKAVYSLRIGIKRRLRQDLGLVLKDV
jgi:hypothetical protein